MPATITAVGADVFYGCGVLTTINYAGSEADWAKIEWNESTNVFEHVTVVFNYAP